MVPIREKTEKAEARFSQSLERFETASLHSSRDIPDEVVLEVLQLELQNPILRVSVSLLLEALKKQVHAVVLNMSLNSYLNQFPARFNDYMVYTTFLKVILRFLFTYKFEEPSSV